MYWTELGFVRELGSSARPYHPEFNWAESFDRDADRV
jgi:hypothetical protein